MPRLDLLLVNPGNREQIYQALGPTLTAIEPPIWAGLIATFIRNNGFSVRIVDAEAETLSPEETAERIAALDPVLTTIVVYGHQPSASTQNMTAAGEVCTAVKRKAPGLKMLLVGGHVSALPERTLLEEDADFVCVGEGPYTILELLKALKANRSDHYGDVKGLWYRNNGSARSNPPAPLIKSLDKELPGIAWDLLPMEKYRAHNWHSFSNVNKRQPYASFYTTLGCPYACTFCCINAPFGGSGYRKWSPQAVVGWIDTLVTKYGVRNIKIADEMFVLNMTHVTGICDAIIERGYDLNIWAYARVDTVQERILDKLKRAGFNWLALGIESGSEHVRDGAQKKFGQDDIQNTVERIKAAGINVIGNFIFGLPDDDMETMQATLDMALDLNCEFPNFYSAMAYPGSRLYDMAIQEGWQLPEKWSGYSQHAVDTLPLPTKFVSAAEVLRFRDNAFQIYCNNPKYLDLVARKFGAETAGQIREMARHKLARKHAESVTER